MKAQQLPIINCEAQLSNNSQGFSQIMNAIMHSLKTKNLAKEAIRCNHRHIICLCMGLSTSCEVLFAFFL